MKFIRGFILETRKRRKFSDWNDLNKSSLMFQCCRKEQTVFEINGNNSCTEYCRRLTLGTGWYRSWVLSRHAQPQVRKLISSFLSCLFIVLSLSCNHLVGIDYHFSLVFLTFRGFPEKKNVLSLECVECGLSVWMILEFVLIYFISILSHPKKNSHVFLPRTYYYSKVFRYIFCWIISQCHSMSFSQILESSSSSSILSDTWGSLWSINQARTSPATSTLRQSLLRTVLTVEVCKITPIHWYELMEIVLLYKP